jgi:Tfp pilus assembly protein PilO
VAHVNTQQLSSGALLRTPVKAQALAAITARRWLALVSDQWLPRLTWSVQRTGRAGLAGLALLLTSLVFLLSTHLPLARQVEELRSDLQRAHEQRIKTPTTTVPDAALLRTLPQRAQMPALLGVLVREADATHLAIDTGKYETTVLKNGGVVTYQISFPVTGQYPQVRQFIDATLAALPTVAVSELSLTRKTIGDGAVEAQIRLTAFTQDRP